MLGGSDGFLKLIFDTSTLKLLGVHAFGEGATEIVHIGQVRESEGDVVALVQQHAEAKRAGMCGCGGGYLLEYRKALLTVIRHKTVKRHVSRLVAWRRNR